MTDTATARFDPKNAPGGRIGVVGTLTGWVLAGVVATFLGWAATAPLDILTMAQGEVTPIGQVKEVQHLEGGIVREILVHEGDRVSPGQPLVELEATASGADLAELNVRVRSLLISEARLDAEAGLAEAPVFPAELLVDRADAIARERELFDTRMGRLANERAGLDEQLHQSEAALNELRARQRNNRRSLELLNEQIKISNDLLKQQITSRYNHLTLLREASELQKAIEEDAAASVRIESAIAQARLGDASAVAAFVEDAKTQLAEIRRSIDELAERQHKLTDTVGRTVLRAPVEGIIKTLRARTIGGVVQPGQTVVDIVPVESGLVVEAKLLPQDVGYVQVGQQASLRLASADASRYGALPATVQLVSPDTLVDDKGRAYYLVRLETQGIEFMRGAQHYRLLPGVQVVAGIHTGQRTVLEYLLEPFLGNLELALRER
jgi:membrane fusion protein, adhesin transport system